MNWLKVFSNIGAVALACATAHHMTGVPDWKSLGISVALCVAANLLGLAQHPPQTEKF